MTAHGPTGTVPSVDSPDNVIVSDVIGNKSDTVAGTSLVALAKQVIARLGLQPAIDSVANSTIWDVLGRKDDTHAGSTVLAFLRRIDEHIHGEPWVLPDRAAPITVTAGNGWAYGAESATLGTPTGPFDTHFLTVVANNNAEYQVQMLVGGVPVGAKSFTRIAVFTSSLHVPFQHNITVAGPITLKLASSVTERQRISKSKAITTNLSSHVV